MKHHISFDIDFKRNPHAGLYIVLEGVNSSGKTTQVELLKKYFEEQGKEVVIASEPNDTLVIGGLVREIITTKKQFPSAALQYLYTADRVVNHETIIEPALKAGKVVISSRCFWSAIVYGVMDRGSADYTMSDAQLTLVTHGILNPQQQTIVPDKTFYLDISADTSLERMQAMGKTRDIYEKKEKLTQLIAGYHWVVKHFPNEFVIIDAEKELEKVTKEIIASTKTL